MDTSGKFVYDCVNMNFWFELINTLLLIVDGGVSGPSNIGC